MPACRRELAGRVQKPSSGFMPAYFAAGRGVLHYNGAARTSERVDPPVQQDETEERLRPLMIRSLEGDSGAHRELLGLLGRYLRGYFARRVGTATAEVEDLVQETLLAVHLKRDSYDRSLPFTPWAYALARYKLIDHFRRRNRSIQVPLEDAGAIFAADNPEEGALRTDLDRLLQRLPERQRSLIEDVKLQGLSVEEAARKRGVTAVSARVMLHRTLKWLNQALGDENG
jgi:RNA polymerase sigma-70 factor, ECF subfamily